MKRAKQRALSKPRKLPQKEFLESFRNVPRLAVNLFITDTHGMLLLTKRNNPPFIGYWHLPGSFLLKNETIIAAQRRVAQDELGFRLSEYVELLLLDAFDDIEEDPRGHVVDIIYGMRVKDFSQIKPTKETAEAKFFARDKLPSDIGFNHRRILHELGFTTVLQMRRNLD